MHGNPEEWVFSAILDPAAASVTARERAGWPHNFANELLGRDIPGHPGLMGTRSTVCGKLKSPCWLYMWHGAKLHSIGGVCCATGQLAEGQGNYGCAYMASGAGLGVPPSR